MKNALMALASLTLLGGCASTQLNINTLDLARSEQDLNRQQIIDNLGRAMWMPESLPSQVDITGGTVTTQDSVTPQISDMVARARQLLTGTTGMGASNTNQFTRTQTRSYSIGSTAQWTQSWAIVPVTDGDSLRRLSALYFYATHPRDPTRINRLIHDYPPIEKSGGGGSGSPNVCVIFNTGSAPITSCPGQKSEQPVAGEDTDKDADPYFKTGLRALVVGAPSHPEASPNLCLDIYDESAYKKPPPNTNLKPLGVGAGHLLYYDDKPGHCFASFMFLIADAIGDTNSPSGGGGKSGTASTGSSQHKLDQFLATPAGIRASPPGGVVQPQ